MSQNLNADTLSYLEAKVARAEARLAEALSARQFAVQRLYA